MTSYKFSHHFCGGFSFKYFLSSFEFSIFIFSVELSVAAPYDFAIRVVGMPDFLTVKAATIKSILNLVTVKKKKPPK